LSAGDAYHSFNVQILRTAYYLLCITDSIAAGMPATILFYPVELNVNYLYILQTHKSSSHVNPVIVLSL